MNTSKILTSNLILLLLFTLVFSSCKKNQLGGKSSVNGVVKHHSKAIAGARIFIKFDATEFPGADTSLYDAKVGADVSGNFSINDFYKGDYYLYAVGKDYAIPAPYIVVGGIAVHLRKNEKLVRTIAVTEGD